MISNSWNKAEGESISQKVMGKVKPDEPLKNRINFAQKNQRFKLPNYQELMKNYKSNMTPYSKKQ